MARHIEAYERLRGAVLCAQARPEGLAAMAYHGLLGGLKVICARAARSGYAAARLRRIAAPLATDPTLVRLLANMVLLYQQEVSHVV